MFVGIGIPIPVLDADIAKRVSIRNEQIETTIVDYGDGNKVLGKTNYEALRSGEIEIQGQKIRTAPVASLYKAREIANELKEWIVKGEFKIQEPVEYFPKGTSLKGLKSDNE